MDYLLRIILPFCALLALPGCLFFHPFGKREKNFRSVSSEERAEWGWDLGREYVLQQPVYLTDANALALPDDQRNTYRTYRGPAGLPPIEPNMTLPDGIKGVIHRGTSLELLTVQRRPWGLGEFYRIEARVRSGMFEGEIVRLEDICHSLGAPLPNPEILGTAQESASPAMRSNAAPGDQHSKGPFSSPSRCAQWKRNSSRDCGRGPAPRRRTATSAGVAALPCR